MARSGDLKKFTLSWRKIMEDLAFKLINKVEKDSFNQKTIERLLGLSIKTELTVFRIDGTDMMSILDNKSYKVAFAKNSIFNLFFLDKRLNNAFIVVVRPDVTFFPRFEGSLNCFCVTGAGEALKIKKVLAELIREKKLGNLLKREKKELKRIRSRKGREKQSSARNKSLPPKEIDFKVLGDRWEE